MLSIKIKNSDIIVSTQWVKIEGGVDNMWTVCTFDRSTSLSGDIVSISKILYDIKEIETITLDDSTYVITDDNVESIKSILYEKIEEDFQTNIKLNDNKDAVIITVKANYDESGNQDTQYLVDTFSYFNAIFTSDIFYTPIREGYYIIGYNTSPDGKGIYITPSSVKKIKSNTVLYCIWQW